MSEHFTYNVTVQDAWLDHNQHMNDAEYNRVFSDTTDAWLAHLGLDTDTIAEIGYIVFTLENHLIYKKEVPQNEKLSVKVRLIDYDAKRCHVFMELSDSKEDICATYEVMLMGIDTASGRPAPFPDNIMKKVEEESTLEESAENPKELGRQIGIKHK